jgi:pimeloyl-ACP methyl ester carboxylesterase
MTLQLLTRKPQTDRQKTTPLLFIHGAWHGAWCWDVYWMPYFAQQGYVCYALSLRGHGDSPSLKPMWRNGIDDYVADIETVTALIIQEHGCHPVLIGHSMGGFVAQKYLEKHAAPGAVLLASIPHFGALRFFLRVSWQYPATLLKSILTLHLNHFVNTPAMTRAQFFSPDVPEADIVRYAEQIGDEAWHMVFDVLLLKLPRPSKIMTPRLVIGAENDKVFSPSEIHRLARAYDTSATILPDSAHDMMLDTHWQAAADEILGWLSDIAPAT